MDQSTITAYESGKALHAAVGTGNTVMNLYLSRQMGFVIEMHANYRLRSWELHYRACVHSCSKGFQKQVIRRAGTR